MEDNRKRKADNASHEGSEKRLKTKKQWRVPRNNDHGAVQAKVIHPGDSGVWATCNKGRERACVGELRDLFTEYAEKLYGDTLGGSPSKDDASFQGTASNGGIEGEIQAEIDELHDPASVQLFTPIRLDVQCVVFFKTVEPIEPVRLVKRICEDAMDASQRKKTRSVKRLSPMTLVGRASAEDLNAVALQVLAPHFHQQPFQSRKFAIRPTLRNHNTLTRDSIIKQIASIVGPGHEVNLKDYDLLIIVEVYKNVCGVSVLDDSFERLKRYNLAEIYDPTPRDAPGRPTVEDSLAGQTAEQQQLQHAANAPAMGMDTS